MISGRKLDLFDTYRWLGKKITFPAVNFILVFKIFIICLEKKIIIKKKTMTGNALVFKLNDTSIE
jgi:hypothetical protein